MERLASPDAPGGLGDSPVAATAFSKAPPSAPVQKQKPKPGEVPPDPENKFDRSWAHPRSLAIFDRRLAPVATGANAN